PRRYRSYAVAGAAQAVGSRMQAACRRVDPADDEFAPSVREAPDATWEVAHKCMLALRERHFSQAPAFVGHRPTWKCTIVGHCGFMTAVEEGCERGGNEGRNKARAHEPGLQVAHAEVFRS